MGDGCPGLGRKRAGAVRAFEVFDEAADLRGIRAYVDEARPLDAGLSIGEVPVVSARCCVFLWKEPESPASAPVSSVARVRSASSA